MQWNLSCSSNFKLERASGHLGELDAVRISAHCHQTPISDLAELYGGPEICILNRHLGIILMQGVFGPPLEKHCFTKRILNSRVSEKMGKLTEVTYYICMMLRDG